MGLQQKQIIAGLMTMLELRNEQLASSLRSNDILRENNETLSRHRDRLIEKHDEKRLKGQE